MLLSNLCPSCQALHGGHFERCPRLPRQPPSPAPVISEEEKHRLVLEAWVLGRRPR